MVARQLHHADLVPVGIRFVHAHPDKRQLAVSVLGVDARTFRFHNKPGFLQEFSSLSKTAADIFTRRSDCSKSVL